MTTEPTDPAFVRSLPPRAASLEHVRIARILRGNPGTWAALKAGPTNRMQALAAKYRGEHRPKVYDEGFEFRARSDGYGSGMATLYGRFVGSAS